MKIIKNLTFLVLLFLLMSSGTAMAQRNVSITQTGDLAVRIEGQTYVCLSENGHIKGFGIASNELISHFNDRVDRVGSTSISYFDGKIDKIGSLSISYFNGKVDRAGNVSISYFDGRVDRISTSSISYFNGQIDKIGDESISYFNGRVDRIGTTSISAESNQDQIVEITLHGNCAY